MLNAVWISILIALSHQPAISSPSNTPFQGPVVLAAGPNSELAAGVVAPAKNHPGVLEGESETPAGPEPTTLLIVGAGLVGLALSGRRLRRSVNQPVR